MKPLYYIKAVLLFFMLLSSLIVSAQNVKEEIKKINAAFENTSSISMDISYAAFSNYYSTKPLETTRGSFKKNGNNYWSKMEEVEMCQNEKCMIYADNEEKQIIISNPPGKPKGKELYMNLDTLMKYEFKSQIKTFGSFNRITFEYNDQDGLREYSKMDIYYDTKTYFINKCVLFYAEEMSTDQEEKGPMDKPRLEISYTNISFSETDKSIFSESNYFLQSGNKISGKGIYKNFEIIDQRFKK
jgi:hypothetical protein